MTFMRHPFQFITHLKIRREINCARRRKYGTAQIYILVGTPALGTGLSNEWWLKRTVWDSNLRFQISLGLRLCFSWTVPLF